jgi:hypothetical protein
LHLDVEEARKGEARRRRGESYINLPKQNKDRSETCPYKKFRFLVTKLSLVTRIRSLIVVS